MAHNRDYTKIMMNLDGTVSPILTPGIVMSMDNSVMDVQRNLKSMKHPYLILVGDKDKIVDNEGA
jgi:esterase/lipase